MTDLYRPASAQVLINTDLLYCIFIFVPLDLPSDRLGDSSLARCAAVRHAFHEPAVRVLWRNLGSLLPLWHLLAPPDTPFPSPRSPNGRDLLRYLQQVNSGLLDLDAARWDRFLWHAARVREIAHGHEKFDRHTISINQETRLLVQSVVVRNGGTTILPLLKTVECRGPYPGSDALVPFFTTTLRQATFDFRGSEEEHIPLLRTLRTSSPILEKMVVFNYCAERPSWLYVQRPSLIIPELARFSRLRELYILHIEAIDGADAFQALVAMPSLTRLTIRKIVGPWVELGRRAISARNLRELSVTGGSPVLSDLFRLTRFETLKSATIHIISCEDETVSGDDLTAFLSLFHNAVSTSDLESFECTLTSLMLPQEGEEPALCDVVAPLLAIRGLRSFSFYAVCNFSRVDDAAAEVFASAWPRLERLCVCSGLSNDSGLSLNALHHLHRHCADLKELCISRLWLPVIGVNSIPPPPCLDPSPSHPLQHMYIKTSETDVVDGRAVEPSFSDKHAEATARYLLDLFPRLGPRRHKHELEDMMSSSGRERTEESAALSRWGRHKFGGRWMKIVGHIRAMRSASGEGLQL